MSMYEGPSRIIFNDAELSKMLESPTGEVGKHLRKVGLEILAGAKAMAGVRTGRLKRSIYMRQGVRGRVQYVQVGSDVSYAHDHHEGTRPHIIKSKTGRVMRFYVGGKVVYAQKSVHHPGTKANRFLTIPMERAVHR